MILRKRFLFFAVLAALVNTSVVAAYGQIIGGTPCSIDLVDEIATCLSHVACAKPPSPIDGFDIGARAFATCPNQPVDNFAETNVTIGGSQALATAQSRAIIFNRLIHREVRGGDCLGNTSLLSLFDDPQGCNPPPPPPPPPDPGGCNNVGGDGFNPVDGGGGSDGCSPIIIDLTGNGFVLTDAQHGVMFDIANTGTPLQIAWTANANNAWLVLDRNQNGIINSGAEMFGNFAAQPASARPNGFAALAVYDDPANGGNGDGVIDARDKIFSSLRLWVDANHDGISQPGELHTLPELGIYSIGLDYSLSERRDEYGNVFRYKARVNQGMLGPADVGKSAYDVFLVTK
jgi:hypothetical protein